MRDAGVMAARRPLWSEIRVRIPWHPPFFCDNGFGRFPDSSKTIFADVGQRSVHLPSKQNMRVRLSSSALGSGHRVLLLSDRCPEPCDTNHSATNAPVMAEPGSTPGRSARGRDVNVASTGSIIFTQPASGNDGRGDVYLTLLMLPAFVRNICFRNPWETRLVPA